MSRRRLNEPLLISTPDANLTLMCQSDRIQGLCALVARIYSVKDVMCSATYHSTTVPGVIEFAHVMQS